MESWIVALVRLRRQLPIKPREHGPRRVEHFLSPRIPGDKTPFALDVVIGLGVYGENGFTKGHILTLVDKKDTIPEIQPELNHSTIGRLAQTVDDYEIVIYPGDFAYADDWWVDSRFLPGANVDNHFETNLYAATEVYQSILERFYGQLAPIAGRKPYMASPVTTKRVVFRAVQRSPSHIMARNFMHHFDGTMPNVYPSFSKNTTAKVLAKKARSAVLPPFWYSFEHGMSHVVMINTETDFKDAPEGSGGSTGINQGNFGKRNQQLEFLNADLASVDRSVTPWEAFEDTFYTYGVDLGIFGHVHNSQRFLPMYQGKVDPNNLTDPTGPMYIIAGGAGNIEGLTPVGPVPPENEFNYADDWSYVTVKLLDEQHLQVDFIKSTTGEILDSSTLFKSHKEQFVR
ncbi:Purple acid phosphatase-like N-terminal [Penicillium waksmanii]|uniref:Purple acid phosphatase-like N-terminal n=1 Tax=Penicillium waksmanii TaxID=69791 RepID=UPI0025479726|nr:Purple acid phosphatase-like N-terminal [Penicillium waksmanii]KAJ5966143.1 Purple acid phosphatase-like N-terminal [Penicillium waksmanii]